MRFPKALPKSFKSLSRLVPPHPIHDDVAYDRAQRMADRLTVIEELARGQAQYLETLTLLMAEYERTATDIDWNNHDAVDNLEHLMVKNGVSVNGLGDLLGNRLLGGRILNGERPLTNKHVRILCDRFRVAPQIFEGPSETVDHRLR
jgi:antitoxin component HigA of HigAB toxin-antitoxin module